VGRAGILTRTGTLAVAAAAGGAVALGGAEVFGKLGSRTTIQQVSPLPGGLGNVSLSTPQASQGSMNDAEIYRRDSPGVVEITATSVRTSPTDPYGFFGPQTTTSEALGSGFVIDKAGHIVTNYHVIAGAQKVQVSFSGQDEISATVVGKDASTDLAVLKIDAHARALTPLPLGDSATVVVGQPVVAIGNPFGLARTLTSGVVSAVQRHIASPNQSQEDAIQTDASINHGNSGGPLIDMHGQVIGVTSQITTGGSGTDGNVGIGFAIPSNTVRTIAAQLIVNGKALHAYLGVDTFGVTQRLARIFNLPVRRGLLVQQVTKGSAAAQAGIVPGRARVVVGGMTYQLGGDIITQVDGRPVASPEQLLDAISGHQPGDRLLLEVYRHGKLKHVTATLGNRPEAAP
jgi:S1-C subfamily serine protease